MKIGIAGPMSLELLDLGVIHTLPVGYEYPSTSKFIRALIDRGHEVIAYTTSIGIAEPMVFNRGPLTVCVARRGPHAARDFFRSERADLMNLMRLHRPDIINGLWTYEFAWAALNTGLPSVISIHDHALSVLRHQLHPYRVVRFLMNYVTLERATSLVANSQYLYQTLPRRHKRKTRVIGNYLDAEYAAPPQRAWEESNVIVSVSNGFGRLKNIRTALEAFHLVSMKVPDLEYRLIGEDMEPGGPASRFAFSRGITERVRFIGKLPNAEVISQVRNAVLFLHPSLEESFGVSVLEAMFAGTTVIGGRESGNIPYLLDYGKAGYLCDVNSSRDIARGIIELITDRALAERLRNYAFEFARRNYSGDKVVDRYLECYADALRGGNQFASRG